MLSLLIAFFTFILSLSIALSSVTSILIFIIGLASTFQGDKQIVIETLILAFLFSPFGLPKSGIYIIGLLELLNYTIKSI
ncbi:CD1845 family protein [Peptoniphilus harei]|uniref:CD1845 family protein n=1 Tax=Peptoniphilus harei TaxID=54005 RepID=UPI001E3300D8|nr:CD1845 family protein [Peptoniphilus harei]MDU6742763.1 CD1845 family protein [Peptoniphilus harei]